MSAAARLYLYAADQRDRVADLIAHSLYRGVQPREELITRWSDYENRCRDALSMMEKR